MDNLIDRKVLLREMEKLYNKRTIESTMTGNRDCFVTWNDAVYLVTVAPTIEAEPIKHGKWIYIRDEENNGLYECSECHKGDIHAKECKVSYCWNCGAQMIDEEDNQ